MPTTGAWKLSQLEFFIAWQAVGRDRMPFPIEFHSAAETRSDLERESAGPRSALIERVREDEGIFRALQALAQPRVRVEAFGFRRDGRDRMVRMHAGIDDSAGGVLVQEPGPGPDPDAAGDIRLYLHSPTSAIKRLVSLLPDVPPGAAHGVSINRLDLAPSETWSPAAPNSARTQAIRFLRQPFRTYVEFKVDLGAALDGWQEGGDYLQVVDFIDQGRYLLTLGDRVEATPLTAEKLQASLQRLADRALERERPSAWR